MNKRTYRAKKVNTINWTQLKERLSGEAAVFAIDIAKEKQYALLSSADGAVSELLYWHHPAQTQDVLNSLQELNSPLTVVMESTGTYGDALRYQFTRLGFEVYQVSAKRVSDAREIYDGVPSLHDAKAAMIISRLHRDGISTPWQESSEDARHLDALRREYDMHQSQYQRNQNRLEAYLSRHWPEVLGLLSLDSVTLESLLITYGSPEKIAADAEAAAEKMRYWGKSQLTADKIEQVIASARNTLGAPCIAAERRYLQALAEEMRHSRLQQRSVEKELQERVKNDDSLQQLGAILGLVTTAILISCRLDPRHYKCARSYQKALGLNLKEKSSGRYNGQLRITKRGSSIARRYLYYAALRLIKNDPHVNAWFQQKADPQAKKKTVTTLMRKLAKALWHVGRGQRFDASQLLTVNG